MNKKIIIYITIAILVLNTFYWINSIAEMVPKYKPKPFDWGTLKSSVDIIFWETTFKETGKPPLYTFNERLSMALSIEASKGFINILLITDAIIIVIAFLMIFLHKDKLKIKKIEKKEESINNSE